MITAERFPSIRGLMRATGGDRKVALAVRKVLDGRTVLKDQWGREHKRHTYQGNAAKLESIDRLLGNFGVEFIAFECQQGNEDYSREVGFSYSNNGDSYYPTVLLSENGFRVAGWADMVEAHERRCSKCRKLSSNQG